MENIAYFVKGLFRGVEETLAIKDQQLELETHIIDHMNDLMASGMNKDVAFNKTIQGLGNLDELIDTMTGRKVFVPINRVRFYKMLVGFIYGCFYMTAIYYGLLNGALLGYVSKFEAAFMSLAGFSGYLVPFSVKMCIYIRHPRKMEAVEIRKKSSIYTPLAGWIGVSVICCFANLILNLYGSGYTSIWAWMPTFGVLTWPMLELAYNFFVKKFSK